MNVRPLHDRILVKRLEAEPEQANTRIIIPDVAKEKPHRGEVLAVGTGRILENGTRIPIDLKVGDKVLFGKYSGSELKVDGQEVLILGEGDIFAVINEEVQGPAGPTG